MIIHKDLALRLFISSPSSGMYKIEHRLLYRPDSYAGIYVNGVPTLMESGHPLYWVDKTEPIYTPDYGQSPLVYCKITYIYVQEDIRKMPIQDVLREGYDNDLSFYTDWCQNYDKTTLTNKRYGLAKMHKRPKENYVGLVLGLRPLSTSVNLRHPAMKGIDYDPDLPDIFHNYMPAMDTDEELIGFLFAEMF